VVDVALVHPPVDTQPLSSAEGQTSEYPLMPMGLFSMADYLERSGFSVRVVNLALERLLNPGAGLRQLLAGLEAEVVGVSLHWFVHSYGAVEVARFVKSLLPDSKVVLGGFTASFFAREIVERYSFIDAVVVGEGEEALLEIASGAPLEKVKGVVYREGRKVLWSGYREPARDLEKYRFTNLKVFDRWNLYLRCSPSGYAPTRRPSFWVAVARSCPMNCAYCGGSREGYMAAMGRAEPALRRPERVAEDVEALAAEYGVKIVKLSHDPLIWGESYYSRLMEEIAKRGLDLRAYWDLTFLPSEELARKALRAFEGGLCWGLSVETVNDEVRARIGRPYTLGDIERFLPVAERVGALLDGYFLVGLPGDTRVDVEKGIEYALETMRRYKNVYFVPPFPYTIDPHAPMALRPKDYGVKVLCGSFECYRRLAKSRKWADWVLHETAQLSRREIAELTERFYKTLVEAYRRGEFAENVALRYSFEHEGAVVKLPAGGGR
jgi:radical SAM superfamily enzyme YgiQ (UPF0313 family)